MPIANPITESTTHATSQQASRVIILADDLTGACDSGVAFLGSGRSVRVILNVSTFDSQTLSHSDVWSFTTESRNLPVHEATRRLTDTMSKLPLSGSLFFKKVDSAARGHLAAEIVAAFHASAAAIALVAPAFPAAGRTVHAGVLRVSDFSGQDATVSLRDLFALEENLRIDILADGPIPEMHRHIADAIANGTDILLCGARTQDHLHQLASAALQLDRPILWAGSAGLAHALADSLPAKSASPAKTPVIPEGRNLLFVGTPHPVTRLQLERLNPALHETYLIECGSTPEDGIRSAFQSSPVSALILTGGDTAAFVLRSLHATTILLAGEVARGIPWGIIEGGLAHGCPVITKSGGFGNPEALLHAFEFLEKLKERSYESS